MRAKRKEMWVCSHCGDGSTEKELAESCCRCSTCKKRIADYVGRVGDRLCTRCGIENELRLAEENFRHAKSRLEFAQKKHEETFNKKASA